MTVNETLRDPLADLAPTARQLVETARRLLLERGHTALSLEAIAGEVGVNKAAVRYYFRDKAGLIATVWDTFIYDSCVAMEQLLALPATEDRLHTFFATKRRLAEEIDQTHPFQLLPLDDLDRQRFLHFYTLLLCYYTKFFRQLLPEASDTQLRELAQLLVGIVDGLSAQYAISPGDLPIRAPFALAESMVRGWIRSNGWSVEPSAGGDVAGG